MAAFLENIFSVKNTPNKTHRVLTLFGIKLKIKRKESLQKQIDSIKKEISEIKFPSSQPYIIQGENNKIIIVEEDGTERELGINETIDQLHITIIGNNNLIKIIQPCNFINAYFDLSTNFSKIVIDKTPRFMWRVKMAAGDNMEFLWGEGSDTAWYGEAHMLNANAGVEVGKDCMFAGETIIFASDAHRIYDINTNEILNDVKHHVIIGDHTWVCQGNKFLKNAIIPKNCIVANNSNVTKEFTEENCLIGGNPAKVIKRNINWIR